MSDQIHVPGLLQAQSAVEQKTNKTAVSIWNNLVVLHVEHPQEYMPFDGIGAVDTGTRFLAFAAQADPQVAQLVINAAIFLVDQVYEMRGALKPASGAMKHELVERHRAKLTKRIEVMLNSTREAKKVSNAMLAKEMVQVMLKEVF